MQLFWWIALKALHDGFRRREARGGRDRRPTDQESHFELEDCRTDLFGGIVSFSESWLNLCAQARSGKTSG